MRGGIMTASKNAAARSKSRSIAPCITNLSMPTRRTSDRLSSTRTAAPFAQCGLTSRPRSARTRVSGCVSKAVEAGPKLPQCSHHVLLGSEWDHHTGRRPVKCHHAGRCSSTSPDHYRYNFGNQISFKRVPICIQNRSQNL